MGEDDSQERRKSSGFSARDIWKKAQKAQSREAHAKESAFAAKKMLARCKCGGSIVRRQTPATVGRFARRDQEDEYP